MRFRITKKIIEELKQEYIEDGEKPPKQIDSRPRPYFDENVINEIYYRSRIISKSIEEIVTIEQLRRLTRIFLLSSEEHANMFKRFKVIGEDVAWTAIEILS